jgi:hypothetical protein
LVVAAVVVAEQIFRMDVGNMSIGGEVWLQ